MSEKDLFGNQAFFTYARITNILQISRLLLAPFSSTINIFYQDNEYKRRNKCHWINYFSYTYVREWLFKHKNGFHADDPDLNLLRFSLEQFTRTKMILTFFCSCVWNDRKPLRHWLAITRQVFEKSILY